MSPEEIRTYEQWKNSIPENMFGGGGEGGSDNVVNNQWRKIGDININTIDTEYELNIDSNGQPFALKEIAVYSKNDTNARAKTFFTFNKQGGSYTSTFLPSKKNFKYTFKILNDTAEEAITYPYGNYESVKITNIMRGKLIELLKVGLVAPVAKEETWEVFGR